MDHLIGKKLGGYHIVAALGKGGMASVYKAYQPNIDRYVALKILPSHLAEDPSFIRRFNNEAKLIARLEHPHILPIYDFGHTDEYTYLVMRLVEGGSLSNLMQKHPIFKLGDVFRIISQVGSALDYAHTHGVIHRDIKPANILLDQQGNCLLSDFGVATITEGASQLTHAGKIIGTPAYISPEQGMGLEVDGRSDIYSLGVVMYQMVTGSLPYYAETPIAVVIKHINDSLPMPCEQVSNLPTNVNEVILKALAKDRQNRHATGTELAVALENALYNSLSDEGGDSLRISNSEHDYDPAMSAVTLKWPVNGKEKKKITEKLFIPAIILFVLLFFGFLNYTMNYPQKTITNHLDVSDDEVVQTSSVIENKSSNIDSTTVSNISDVKEDVFHALSPSGKDVKQSESVVVSVPKELTIDDLIPAPTLRTTRPLGSSEIKLLLDFNAEPPSAQLQLENHPLVKNSFLWRENEQPSIIFQYEDQAGRYDFQGLLYGDNEPTATTFCLFIIGKLHFVSNADGSSPINYLVTMLAPDYNSIQRPTGTWFGWASPSHGSEN
ncbi:MAG: serine/threonine protein kinase [Desulfobulbaceae bacterium]|nr:serine/threonine protein kinase [Desulfobulbaceae bacterium]